MSDINASCGRIASIAVGLVCVGWFGIYQSVVGADGYWWRVVGWVLSPSIASIKLCKCETVVLVMVLLFLDVHFKCNRMISLN